MGRNGMHKYNNQDHSMMTAMLADKNIIAGKELYNLWDVNEDAEYHEGGERGTSGRMVPQKVISLFQIRSYKLLKTQIEFWYEQV